MDELPVPSPCISVCAMNDRDEMCKGCFRTRDEIGNWLYYSNAEKRAVLERLKQRKNV